MRPQQDEESDYAMYPPYAWQQTLPILPFAPPISPMPQFAFSPSAPLVPNSVFLHHGPTMTSGGSEASRNHGGSSAILLPHMERRYEQYKLDMSASLKCSPIHQFSIHNDDIGSPPGLGEKQAEDNHPDSQNRVEDNSVRTFSQTETLCWLGCFIIMLICLNEIRDSCGVEFDLKSLMLVLSMGPAEPEDIVLVLIVLVLTVLVYLYPQAISHWSMKPKDPSPDALLSRGGEYYPVRVNRVLGDNMISITEIVPKHRIQRLPAPTQSVQTECNPVPATTVTEDGTQQPPAPTQAVEAEFDPAEFNNPMDNMSGTILNTPTPLFPLGGSVQLENQPGFDSPTIDTIEATLPMCGDGRQASTQVHISSGDFQWITGSGEAGSINPETKPTVHLPVICPLWDSFHQVYKPANGVVDYDVFYDNLFHPRNRDILLNCARYQQNESFDRLLTDLRPPRDEDSGNIDPAFTNALRDALRHLERDGVQVAEPTAIQPEPIYDFIVNLRNSHDFLASADHTMRQALGDRILGIHDQLSGTPQQYHLLVALGRKATVEQVESAVNCVLTHDPAIVAAILVNKGDKLFIRLRFHDASYARVAAVGQQLLNDGHRISDIKVQNSERAFKLM